MSTTTIQPARKIARHTWSRTPQRVWLRRALFQVHLWVGIVLAAYSIVIGISGAALVFKERLEARETRGFVLSSEPSIPSLADTLHHLEADRPGWRVGGLKLEDRPGAPITALMYRVGATPDGNYRSVIFDPQNAHAYSDRMRFSGTLGWLANLHFNLLAGRKGLVVSGWMAFGLLMLCVSGIVLWWPGVARWTGAMLLRVHRNRHRHTLNWKRLNWDLHSVVGFWACTALLAVTVTGLYFAFPTPVRNVVVLATGGSIRQADAQEDSPARSPVASTAPLLTVDQALDAARRQLPAEAPPGYLALPARPGASWYVTGYYRGALPYSRLVSLTLDPRTGEILRSSDTTREIRGLRLIQYVFTIHFGSFGGDGTIGLVVRSAWVLVGLAPALLAITGLVMFWNRKLRPR